jgi:hypothetical protein
MWVLYCKVLADKQFIFRVAVGFMTRYLQPIVARFKKKVENNGKTYGSAKTARAYPA